MFYEKWFDLLFSRSKGEISQTEFERRRNELIRGASDAELEQMAFLPDVSEAIVTTEEGERVRLGPHGIPICQIRGERATRPGDKDSMFYQDLDYYTRIRAELQDEAAKR